MCNQKANLLVKFMSFNFFIEKDVLLNTWKMQLPPFCLRGWVSLLSLRFSMKTKQKIKSILSRTEKHPTTKQTGK